MEVPTQVTLSWTPIGEPDGYDVYFGKPPDTLLLVAFNRDVNEYLVDKLTYDTTYSWRVDARRGSTVVQGPVWNFTTTSAPPEPEIQVTIYDTYPAWKQCSSGISTNEVAFPFLVEDFTYQLQRITVQGYSKSGGAVFLYLHTDDDGKPGAEIGSWGP
jgi:hypothetical protein